MFSASGDPSFEHVLIRRFRYLVVRALFGGEGKIPVAHPHARTAVGWAAGLPVLANRVGGIPGFTTNRENILLAEKDGEAALVERMGELADEPSLRKSLVVAARVQKIHDFILRD